MQHVQPAPMIGSRARDILRMHAAQVAQHAVSPEQEQKRRLWTRHNDLKTNEPVVFIDPENGWNEIIPAASLQCEGNIARSWEVELRNNGNRYVGSGGFGFTDDPPKRLTA